MNKLKSVSIFIFVLLFSACNLFTKATPQIHLTNFDSTFGGGETISISVTANDVKQDVFAISLRLIYDPEYISFNADQSNWIGDVWSDEALGILEDENHTIYISITEVAGSSSLKPNGTILTLDFTLEQIGAFIDFVDDQLFFYDEDGAAINISNLEIEGITIE